MTKRTKYTVTVHDETARFSDLHQAQLFAAWMSQHRPGYWIEVSSKSGLVGQYRYGLATPEFKDHHVRFENDEAILAMCSTIMAEG